MADDMGILDVDAELDDICRGLKPGCDIGDLILEIMVFLTQTHKCS